MWPTGAEIHTGTAGQAQPGCNLLTLQSFNGKNSVCCRGSQTTFHIHRWQQASIRPMTHKTVAAPAWTSSTVVCPIFAHYSATGKLTLHIQISTENIHFTHQRQQKHVMSNMYVIEPACFFSWMYLQGGLQEALYNKVLGWFFLFCFVFVFKTGFPTCLGNMGAKKFPSHYPEWTNRDYICSLKYFTYTL